MADTKTLLQPLAKTLAHPLLMVAIPLKKNHLPYPTPPNFQLHFPCVSCYRENTDLAEAGPEILVVPLFHSVTAQLSGMRGEMVQKNNCSSHRRTESREQISLQSLCTLGVLICRQRLPVHSSPASETQGCGFHLGATEFMGSSSLCNICATETPRT